MNYSRTDRLKSFFKKLTADFFKNEIALDSLVTVIDFSLSRDLRNGTVLLSIFPDNEEKKTLAHLAKKKKGLRDYFKSHTKTKIIPFIDFKIDKGEKNRQRIDELLKKDE